MPTDPSPLLTLTLSEGHSSQELLLHPPATVLQQIVSAQHRREGWGGQPAPANANPHLSLLPALKEIKHQENEAFAVPTFCCISRHLLIGRRLEELKLNTHTHIGLQLPCIFLGMQITQLRNYFSKRMSCLQKLLASLLCLSHLTSMGKAAVQLHGTSFDPDLLADP